MTTSELEFVDDWSPLKEACFVLESEDIMEYDYCECEGPCGSGHAYVNCGVQRAIETVARYVPILIEQYSKLLELSFMLTEAWDAANQNKTPSGLIVEEFRL